MNTVKQIILLLFVCLLSFNMVAQTENTFHDRAFWKENPSVAIVNQKITEGNDATVFNDNAFDAVVFALLENADDDVIKYLLALDGNPINKRTHDSRTYLHWAAYAGKTEIMKTLLAQGASVTDFDSHGNTPLTFAANAGQMDMNVYHIFIEYGVNLAEEKNEDGANALLLMAPYLSNEKEIAYFTNKGIALASTDNEGNGIFNYAAKKGNIDFLKLLVEKGVAYKSLNKKGGNAFLFAAQGGRGYSNPIAVYEYLKSLGLDPNVVTTSGNTPLHRLAYNNTDPAIFKFFLSSGATVNQADSDGNTPFLNATSRNNLEMVKLLSENVKDFNAKNKKGESALMLSVYRNNPEVVAFLLENGSDTSAKDTEGNTLAYYLVESFSSQNVKDFDAKLALLHNEGLKMNTLQADGNTLYHLAAKNNNLELLKKLLAFNISINAKNQEGLTALHIAAMKAENYDMMKYLISKGADKKIQTDFEETVFDLATENEQLQKQNLSLNFLK